jgi:hypothetical protein
MNVEQPIASKILKRLRARKGKVVPTREFLDLGKRPAVDQSLSRLVRRGVIRRVGRGLYELPRMGKLLKEPLVQSPDHLVRSWARKNGLRVVPSGALAANLLGLSTQVPAKITYYTNGRTRTLTLGPYTVRLLNRGPKTMDVGGETAPLVVQALRHLGRDGVTLEAIRRLQSALTPAQKSELKDALGRVPAWMEPVILRIVGGERR